jgi:hypothetical protein
MAPTLANAKEWRDENRWHDPFDIYAAPVAGLVISNMTEFDSKTTLSPYIGGMIQTYFNNHIGMSFELGFSRQGAQDAWDNFHSDDELRKMGVDPSQARGPYDYSFTCMNTLYKIRYYPIRNFCATAGFLFNVHLTSKAEKESSDGTAENNISGHLHKRSAHIIAGLGYETKNLYVEGYYGFPLSRLAYSSFGKQRLGDARLHVFMVTLGYRFKVY